MKKLIHYCWFGMSEKPKLVLRCIESWKKFFPGFQIIEWNEDNIDIRSNIYISQAYDAKKYAFVADYVRFWALEQYGGLYFDTDVEVIKEFGELLNLEAFSGFETKEFVAPGLVLWAKEPHHPVIVESVKYYQKARFLDDKGERIKINVCGIFTNILKGFGFQPNNSKQICNGMTIFPKEYFCPYDDATGVLSVTDNTYAVHWYAKSWMSKRKIFRNRITRVIHRLFGTDIKEKLVNKRKNRK